VAGVYDRSIDRDSAYETLKLMAEQAALAAETLSVTPPPQRTRAPSRGSAQTPLEAFAVSAMRSLGTQIGRQLARGVVVRRSSGGADFGSAVASLSASLAKVGSNTLLSRVLGFVRDMIVAHVFGADAATDAFFVAFKMPNLMRRLFAEGAFSAALVPVLHEYRRNRGFGADLKRFVDRPPAPSALVLLLITVLGVLRRRCWCWCLRRASPAMRAASAGRGHAAAGDAVSAVHRPHGLCRRHPQHL
jgi:hypothetical protein